jgi:integrase
MPTKITETVRSALLRRPLKPSVTRDSEILGLCLHVTTRRAFWALSYQPKGTNPATGRRWGGGVRHELGDAMLVPVSEARGLALAAKAVVRAGGDPHRAAMTSRASVVAERSILPKSTIEALDAYSAALLARRQPSEATRRKSIHYARKAIRLMKAESLALAEIEPPMARVMLETMKGAEGERRLTFRGLARFLAWCGKQGLVDRNICDHFDRDEKPRGAASRNHVPSLDELRGVWSAVENEPQRDLVRFLLLVPLRRAEAAGLMWSEVNLYLKRIQISANRTKAREVHELPLSAPAMALIKARKAAPAQDELVFPAGEGKPYNGFPRLLKRIRTRIGKGEAAKAEHFVLHDIRRGFVSHLAERGYDVDLLDQCLGHSRRGVFAIYQRASRMAERAQAMETWGALIAGEGESQNVVAFRAAQRL